MLQLIRDKTQGWLTNTVIGILILVFMLWGIHAYLELHQEKGDKIIAKVAGQTLSQREFDTLYQRVYRQEQIRLGAASLADKNVTDQIKKQILTQWTLMQRLASAAHQENYRLSQAEIDTALLSIPIFQASGHFSSTRFYKVLEAMGYTEASFLTELKNTLLINQVRQGLIQTAFSLPEERKEANALIHQKRDFAYLIIPSSTFLPKQLTIPTAQALAYYQANKNRFMQPEQVSIEYIKLSLAQKDRALLEKRDKLVDLSYTNPNSLAKVAQELNLPIQTTPLFDRNGGHSPLTKDEKIISAAFSPDVLQGNNSPVIDLNDTTVLVLRIKEHKAAALQPFSAVKTQILSSLKKQIAFGEMHRVGEKLLSEVKKGSFSKESAKLNLNWHIINRVDRKTDKVPFYLLNAVFQLPHPKQGKNVFPVTGFSLPNGDYVLIKLIAVHDGERKDLHVSQKAAENDELEKSSAQIEYDLYVRGLSSVT
jgi:peptidyl-prolyl cis-trans isomerase D